RQILAHLDLNVNVRTVQNVLHQSPNHRWQKLKKQALQNHHKEARLNFATKHISWSDQWNSIIFSDEKEFNLDGPDGIHYYWHDLRSEDHHESQFWWWAGDASDYQRTLSDFILPVGSQLGGPQWIFQQDNFADYGVKVLDWPSLSPDLNPIENLWGIMVWRLYPNGHQFKSIEELKTKICEIWSVLELQQLRNLVESMPRRLLEVIKSKRAQSIKF
ncbi:hypothetical protein B4U79_11022, partial [Dinothrombium tinctorium]